VQATPSLRAYERDQLDLLVAQVSNVIADRLRLDPEDPEPRIAAAMLLQLWDIQARSLITHLGAVRTPARLRELVRRDVHRAGRVVADGLNALDGAPPPTVSPLRGKRHSAQAAPGDQRR